MASVKKSDIPRMAEFMQDYWAFVKKYWIPEKGDDYWAALVADEVGLERKYPDELCKRLLLEYVNSLEKQLGNLSDTRR